MKPAIFAAAFAITSCTALAQAPTPTPTATPSPLPAARIFVPDGQLVSSPIKVYVTPLNLDSPNSPTLRLVPLQHWNGGQITDVPKCELVLVAPNQFWTETIAGQAVQRQGTLLIFDARKSFSIQRFKSTSRATPILTWSNPNDTKSEPKLVGEPIYLGNFGPAVVWTLATIVAMLLLIRGMVKKTKPSVLYLVSGPDDYMSLWRTQLAAWTIAVGSLVFLFGIIQLRVPRIPESLVALMGLSVATGGLSAVADRTKEQKSRNPPSAQSTQTAAPPANGGATSSSTPATAPGTPGADAATTASTPAAAPPAPTLAPPKAAKPQLSHLISTYDPHIKAVVLSIPKAQMVFWTGVILILFVLKSWLNGELWEVPWEMVTLTGVSQAGYIADKAVETAKI
jgi:hypothetical protein